MATVEGKRCRIWPRWMFAIPQTVACLNSERKISTRKMSHVVLGAGEGDNGPTWTCLRNGAWRKRRNEISNRSGRRRRLSQSWLEDDFDLPSKPGIAKRTTRLIAIHTSSNLSTPPFTAGPSVSCVSSGLPSRISSIRWLRSSVTTAVMTKERHDRHSEKHHRCRYPMRLGVGHLLQTLSARRMPVQPIILARKRP